MARRSRTWKLLGLAGVAGVAATGAVLARDERRRRAYTADDVRTRLHDRHATLAAGPGRPDGDSAHDGPAAVRGARAATGRLLRRLTPRRREGRGPRP